MPCLLYAGNQAIRNQLLPSDGASEGCDEGHGPSQHFIREKKSYGISSCLIAQLAKNFAIRGGKGVSGKALVSFILNQIRGVREQVGGKVVFLEYEKGNAKLREFYRLCGFEEFKIPSDSEDSGQLGQMFCFLNDEPPTGGPGS